MMGSDIAPMVAAFCVYVYAIPAVLSLCVDVTEASISSRRPIAAQWSVCATQGVVQTQGPSIAPSHMQRPASEEGDIWGHQVRV